MLISRIRFVLFTMSLPVLFTSILTAQDQPARNPKQPTGQVQIRTQTTQIQIQRGGKVPQPKNTVTAPNRPEQAPQAPQATPLSPELEALLEKWEEKSAEIKSLHGQQTKSEVNRVFNVEKVCKGPFFLETPDKGRIDMLAAPITKGKVSRHKDPKTDKPFELVTGQPEIWICDGKSIVMITVNEKTYQQEEIPEEQRGKNIVHSPLPFLFGMKAEEAKTRFKLTLDKVMPEYVILTVVPRMASDRQNYQEAKIKLNTKTYLPDAVLIKDPSNSEITYTFENVKINDNGLTQTMRSWFKGDPFEPNLANYKRVLPPEDPIAANEIRQQRFLDDAPAGKATKSAAGGSDQPERTPQNDRASQPSKPKTTPPPRK